MSPISPEPLYSNFPTIHHSSPSPYLTILLYLLSYHLTSGQVDHLVMDLQNIKNWTLLLYILPGTSLIHIPKINPQNGQASTMAIHRVYKANNKENESQNVSLNPLSSYI